MPLGLTMLGELDVLIAGLYVATQHSARGLLGSANHRRLVVTRDEYNRVATIVADQVVNCPDRVSQGLGAVRLQGL